MRWVFFSLLILNVVYLVWQLALGVAPEQVPPGASARGAPEKLVLLSEVPGGVTAGADARSPRQPGLCPAIGPFSGLTDAERVLAELRTSLYFGEVRAVRVKRDRLHWVFLPPYPTREDALRVLRDLQARKVDSFIVSEGEEANAISLGYFSSEESARGLKVKMETAGYPAGVRETAKEVTEYWVFFPVSGIPDGAEALRGYLAEHPSVSGEQVSCSGPGQFESTAEADSAPDALEGQ